MNLPSVQSAGAGGAVPALDLKQNLPDAREAQLVFGRQLGHGEIAKEALDSDLSIVGFEGAMRVKEIEDQRVVQAATEPLEPARDRAGGSLHQVGDLSITCSDAEGEFDQRLVVAREEGDAFPEPVADLAIRGSKGGPAFQNDAFRYVHRLLPSAGSRMRLTTFYRYQTSPVC